jgi:hypothetical protein
MDPHARAVSVRYRIAGLISREPKTLAVEIIEAEIRSAPHDVLLDAARLVLCGEPVEIARQLRDQLERAIRPPETRLRLPARGDGLSFQYRSRSKLAANGWMRYYLGR